MDNRPNRIKEVLVRWGIGQKDLGAQLKKNEHIVSSWCFNKSQPQLKRLYKIEEILEVISSDLYLLVNGKD